MSFLPNFIVNFCWFSKKDFSLILSSIWTNFISLDFLFNQLSVDMIHQFSSRFSPSICHLTNCYSKSIRIWALTCEGYYSKYKGSNWILLVSLESSNCSLSIHRWFSRFGYHLINQFKDLEWNLYFSDCLFIDFGKITINPILF